MVRPTASGIEWQTAYESTSKRPIRNGVPSTIRRALTLSASLCSRSFVRMPPSGMIRSALVTEQRHLIRGLLLRRGLRDRRLAREQLRERREVRLERRAQRGLMQRRRGVIDREYGEAVVRARLAVNARDGFGREELVHRVATERDDDARLKHLEMPPQPHVAGRDLVR